MLRFEFVFLIASDFCKLVMMLAQLESHLMCVNAERGISLLIINAHSEKAELKLSTIPFPKLLHLIQAPLFLLDFIFTVVSHSVSVVAVAIRLIILTSMLLSSCPPEC